MKKTSEHSVGKSNTHGEEFANTAGRHASAIAVDDECQSHRKCE